LPSRQWRIYRIGHAPPPPWTINQKCSKLNISHTSVKFVKFVGIFSEFVCEIAMFFQSKHTTILQLYGFCPGQPGEPVPEETFTHSHLLWSSVIPYLLRPSFMIHGILLVQFTCLTVFFHNLQIFFGLPLCLAPSTFYISSPNHCLLFAAHAHTIAIRNLFCCSTEIVIYC